MPFVFEGFQEDNNESNKNPGKFVFEGYQNEDYPKQLSSQKESSALQDIARGAAQSAIGLGTGAVYANPALAGAAGVSEFSFHPAVQNVIGELLESDIEQQALFPGQFPALERSALEKGAEEAEKKYLGNEGLVSGVISAPFRAAGMDVTPKNQYEKSVKSISELFVLLRSGNLNIDTAKKALAGALVGEASKEAAEAGGAPEWLSQLLGILTGAAAPNATKLAEISSGQRTPEALQKMYNERAAVMETFQKNPKTDAQKLSEKAIGQDRLSPYIIAQQALEQAKPTTVEGQPLSSRPESKGSVVKISPESPSKPIGMVTETKGPGAKISPLEFESDATAGRSLSNAIVEEATAERAAINQEYNAAKESYRGMETFSPTLSHELQEARSIFESTLEPNSPERIVINRLDSLIERIGTPDALRNIPVNELIAEADTIGAMLNWDARFGGKKDILRRIVRSLDQAAIQGIERNGGNADLFRAANARRANFAQKFENSEIRPFLERQILDPESLFKKTYNDPGTFRAVQLALPPNARGVELYNGMSRKIAEDLMSDYIKNPSLINSTKYSKNLRNLTELIGKERSDSFDKELRKVASRQRISEITRSKIKESVAQKPSGEDRLTKLKESIAEHSELSPEDLTSKLNSRTGIKQLKKGLSTDNYDKLTKEKLREVFQGGKVEGEVTGNSLYESLNNSKNYEIVSEILGEETAESLRLAAKELGKKELNNKSIGNIIKILAKRSVGVKNITLTYAILKLLV